MGVVYIFGHRNPDTDSVCASICLSYLKNKIGENTAPRVLGHINKETKFVLNYFLVKEPEYLNNVKVQLRNIEYNKKAFLNGKTSVIDAVLFMQENGITALPIVNDNKKISGFITLKEIATILIKEINETLNTSYDNILTSLNAREVIRYDEEIQGHVMVGCYQSQTFIDEVKLTPNDILIIGDRYKVLDYAIDSCVKLIILTGNHILSDDLLAKAKKNKVNIIITSFSTYKTGNLVPMINYIETVMLNKSPVVVNYLDYRSDFINIANKIGYTNYPIVNKKNDCLGMIKVTDVDKYTKQKVILVDHNNLEQSVSGIEEAEIEEIIDHHNLGAIGTSIPINFCSMPVGCTCTIVFKKYRECNVDIPKDIAGLMLSAILSDTLLFKSPTTTKLDVEAANELAIISEININLYGKTMLSEASSIKGMSIEDIFYQDFKSYKVGTTTLGISQVITMDFIKIKENINDYINKINEISKREDSIVTLFVTDIIKNGSYVLFNEEAKDIISESFDLDEIEEGTFIPNLVSRKKQMLPKLIEILERRN